MDVLRRQWSLFAATLDGTVLPPYEVLIHPSSTCNLRCQWCIGDHVPLELWGDGGQPKMILDASKSADQRLPDLLAIPENMLGLAEDLVAYRVTATPPPSGEPVEFRVRNVSFSGLIGEPLAARRALVPALRLLAANEMRVGIFTNGVLIDDEVAETLLGIAYVHVSLDAATPETYAELKLNGRPAGEVRFRQALENLRELAVERRRRAGCELELNASFVLYPANHHEVYDAAVLLREAGVDTLRLKEDISGDRPLSAEQRAQTAVLVQRIRDELEDESFRVLEIHRLGETGETERRFSTCSITNMVAAVGSDGQLYPCNYHPRPGGASYGSAIEDGFRTVWESKKRADLRQRLPAICPKVCDPFKNRANGMLATASAIAADQGLEELRRQVGELHVGT